MADLMHDAWSSWEIDPSTRTSTHPFTKYYPFSTTLSTTNTAQDLFTIDRGKAGVNLVTNPSVENATITEFTATGSTISQSSTYAADGSNSLKNITDNAAAGEGFYTTQVIGHGSSGIRVLSGQAVVRGDGGSPTGTVQIVIEDADGTTLATGNTVTLSTSFQQLQVQYVIPRTTRGTTAYVKVVTPTQQSTTFYADKIHNEVRTDSSYSSYIAGDLGRDYAWEGTADLSISKKRVDSVVIRGIRLHTSHNTYLAFDCDASSSTGIYIKAPTTDEPHTGFFETNFPIDFREKISFVNATGSETPTVYGVIWGIHQA